MGPILRNFAYYVLLLFTWVLYLVFLGLLVMFAYSFFGIPPGSFIVLKSVSYFVIVLMVTPLLRPIANVLQLEIKKALMFKK